MVMERMGTRMRMRLWGIEGSTVSRLLTRRGWQAVVIPKLFPRGDTGCELGWAFAGKSWCAIATVRLYTFASLA